MESYEIGTDFYLSKKNNIQIQQLEMVIRFAVPGSVAGSLLL